MEYIKGADLHTHCLNQYFRDEYFATFYVAQIVLALEHLHTMGIIYRDLKPQNVLVQLDGHIKLIDFGLSKTIKKNQKAYSFCGTAAYMSPEILLNEPYDFTSDWYSLVKFISPLPLRESLFTSCSLKNSLLGLMKSIDCWFNRTTLCRSRCKIILVRILKISLKNYSTKIQSRG